MTGKHAVKAWLGVCLVSLLTACSQGNGFSDLDQFMAETRAKPRGYVEPLPEFKAYEAFSYSAADRRAPFEPPIDVQLTMKTLEMVGTLQGASGNLFALIEDDTGGIHRVRTGNYMGQNYGRIVGVSETRIELIEIVPNGRGGWVERPRSLTLEEGAG